MVRIETSILENLLHDTEFARKVFPYTLKEYFNLNQEKIVLSEISDFFTKYNRLPTPDILRIELSNRNDITQTDYEESLKLVDEISERTDIDTEWLVEQAESLYKDRAVYNALYDSLYIVEGKDKLRSPDAIPGILSDALGVGFSHNIGHDYFDDMKSRYDFYHKTEDKIPFDLELMNKITGNGLPKKSLSAVMSGPGGGKSLFMCHYTASCLLKGKNVLYISMEMSEERLAERIDANMMNLNIRDIANMSYESFTNKVDKLKSKTNGKLIIKEYPTGSAHAGHFRALIQELKLKKDFVPDVIVIDYLGICASQRVKNTGANSFTIIKSVAEELRSLAMEFDVPILTAVQVNRSGVNNSDVDMTNISESLGIAMTLDILIALIRSEELDALGQIMVKQIKNRYGSLDYYRKFVVGVDFGKMKLFDAEPEAQEGLADVGDTEEDKPLFGSGRKDYSQFNFG